MKPTLVPTLPTDPRCPHCRQDLRAFGIAVADHHDRDRWLCDQPEAHPIEPAHEHLRNALQLLGAAQVHSDEQGRQIIDYATRRIWAAIKQCEGA